VNHKPALRSYVGKEVFVGVRPEDLKDLEEHPDWPQDRRISSTAEMVEALGSEIMVHFHVAAPRVSSEDGTIAPAGQDADKAAWVAMFDPRSFVKLADTIQLGVDTSRLYFFDPATGDAIRT
jgi:multiple sugar transport system ATP-binding protein